MKTHKILSALSLLTAAFLAVFLIPIHAGAQVLYPYYHPFYRPVDTLAPPAAALGPWDWNFNIGGGPTSALGDTHNHLNGGWNFTVGTGYNFSPRFGLDLELMNAGLGLTDAELAQNQAIDGSASVWAVTLDPIWRFRIGGPVGGYLIGGGGYYQRTTSLDEPFTVFVPTFDGGFDASGVDTVRHTDDAGGLNVGAGLTCNLGWGTKLFVEARYHYIFTPNYPTQILPITIGLRW